MARIATFAIVCLALTGVALADGFGVTQGYVYHGEHKEQGAYVVAHYWNGEATGYSNDVGWYSTSGSGNKQAPYQNWTHATYDGYEDEKEWSVEQIEDYPVTVHFYLHLPDPKK